MLSARSNAQKSSMSFVLLLLFPVLRHWKCMSQYILLAVELTLLLGVAPTRLPTTARVAPEKKEKKRKEEKKKERKKQKENCQRQKEQSVLLVAGAWQARCEHCVLPSPISLQCRHRDHLQITVTKAPCSDLPHLRLHGETLPH